MSDRGVDVTRVGVPLGWLVPMLGGAGVMLVLAGIAWGTSETSIGILTELSKAQAIHLAEIDRHLGAIDVSMARIAGASPTKGFSEPGQIYVPIDSHSAEELFVPSVTKSPALPSPSAGIPARR